MATRDLPQLSDHDAEYRLITAIAVTPELLEHAGELAPDAFHMRTAGDAWGKLIGSIRAGQAVITSDYTEFFVPGEAVPLPEYVREDARRIGQMAYQRAAAEMGHRIARAAYYKPADLEEALQTAATLAPGATANSLMPANQVVAETWDELVNREQLLANLIPTGLHDLDEALGGGLERQTSSVLMARPAMGKTAALVQIADYASARGLVVAVFSKEMSRRQWIRRTAFRRAHASWLAFKQGKLLPDLETAVYDWLQQIAARETLWIDDSTPQTTGDVLAACKRLARRAGRVDLVIADHLRLFSDTADNETHRLGAVSWAFKQLAKNLNTAVLSAAQINRGVESQGERRPDLKDLRDSGEIEENTDAVIGLYRDSYYSENQADKTAEFIVRKARDGERNARVKFVFIPEYMGFEPLAKDGSNGRRSAKPKEPAETFSQSAVALV